MNSKKELVLDCILDSEVDINESDLKELQEEYISFIDWFIETSPKLVCETIKKKERHHSLFRKDTEEDTRIVVIGDIHCDFTSLKGILHKLTISSYNYFEKAYFVFLGDYIDRGAKPLQTLRLIFKLKQILGERCILMRGNHDCIFYDEEKETYYSKVSPSETIDLFNEYFDKKTIAKFKDLFDHLPFYVTINRKSKTYFFVHGGIPKDVYFDAFPIKDILEVRLPLNGNEENQTHLYQVLYSMLWGDPSVSKFKNNAVSTRFEFGSDQFEGFKKIMGFTNLVRGHESKTDGFEPKFDNQLFTVFSSGGIGNETSYYADEVTNPSFAIIYEDGDLRPESVFTYRMLVNEGNKLYSNSNLIKTSRPNEKEPYEIELLIPEEVSTRGIESGITSNKFLNEEFFIKIEISSIPEFLKKLF